LAYQGTGPRKPERKTEKEPEHAGGLNNTGKNKTRANKNTGERFRVEVGETQQKQKNTNYFSLKNNE